MKKTMLLNTSLLLVLAFWLMPSAFSQNRKVQTHQEQTTMWSVPGTVTVSYYLDDEGNVIRHGRQLFSCKFDNTARRSPGVDARKVVIEGYIDYKDDYRDGGINVSFEFFENGNKANAKVNGTFKNDLMDGTWNVLGLQGVSSTFTIKDRRVISFKVNNGKNGAFTSDAQGKLSGTLDENVMKNGIVINTMKYKSGIESTELTPKAKTMLAQLSKREVSSKELVENGFYLEELGETFNLYTFVAAALEQFSEIVKVDQDLNKPNYCSLLCQIKDSQWASFEQCKKLLDEAQKKSGFSAMDELADRMITNYNDGNGHYLNPEVVQSVENYKSTAKEQWFENIKRDIAVH